MKQANLSSRCVVSSSRKTGALLALAAAVVPWGVARAANIAYSLTPADANFSGINWTSGVTVPGAPTVAATSGDALFFGGAPTFTTLTNDLTGATFAGLTFNSGAAAFTIGGNAFALTGSITNNSTTAKTINNNIDLGTVAHPTIANTGTITLGGILSGSAAAGIEAISKTGTGTLILSGANTYTGTTRANGGILRVTGSLADSSAVLVTSGSYDVAVSDTVGTLAVNNANVTGVGTTLTASSASATAFNYGTTTTSLTSVALAGSGGLAKSASGIATLSGANTYTGGTSITGGTLSVTGSLADTGSVTANGGTYDVAASDTVGAVTVGNGSITGAGTLTGSSYTFINTGGPAITATVSAKLAGTGTLTKSAGSGTVLLSGANTYSGGTTLTAGRIQITNASALGTGTVTRGGAATLELNLAGTNTVSNTFAPVTPNDVTTLNVAGTSIATAATPFILNTAGTNTISSNLTHANTTGGTGFAIASEAGLLTIAGNVSNLRLNTTQALALGGAGNGVVSGAILSTTPTELEAVIKYGAGTWTLTGTNTHTTTDIITGTLAIGNGGTTGTLGTGAVTMSNSSNLTFNRSNGIAVPNVISGAGTVTHAGTGTTTLSGVNTYTGVTTISAGVLKATSDAYATLLSNAGGVDLGNTGGKLQLDYTATTSPVATVKTILTAGYPSFATGQIRSTTLAAGRTIGYGDNGTNLVTVRVTLPGDADLDGDVDFNDFLALQGNFGSTGTRFDQGNFNYDNATDFNDFLALQGNFGQSVGFDAVAFTKAQVAAITAFGLDPANQAVPEPACLAMLGLGAAAGLRRRRSV